MGHFHGGGTKVAREEAMDVDCCVAGVDPLVGRSIHASEEGASHGDNVVDGFLCAALV